jgi:peroxiredoxin
MKARYLLLLALVGMVAGGCPQRPAAPATTGPPAQPAASPCDAPSVGTPVAKLDLTTLTGEKLSVGVGSSTAGQVVVADFWAMLCSGCIDGLQHYQADPDLVHNPKVQIIAFCMDTSAPAVKSFVKEKGFTFPVVMATDEIKQAFGVTGKVVLPEVRILEPGGVLHSSLGTDDATPDVIKCIVDKLVKQSG